MVKPIVAGIVAEYNPFHNGHAHQINVTRAAGATHIVAVMSGNFVQRGGPACIPKTVRANAAVACGVDLVLELPLPFATATAERFAFGALGVLGGLGCVDVISFGSECGNLELLSRATEAVLSPYLDDYIKNLLGGGSITYARARQKAVAALYGEQVAQVLESPNNTLAVEYMKQIALQELRIAPFAVTRAGAAHDSLSGRGMGGNAIGRAGDNAGGEAGGNSGSEAGGNSGSVAGGNSGSVAGGNSGSEAGGNSGSEAGGNSGSEAGGNSGDGSRSPSRLVSASYLRNLLDLDSIDALEPFVPPAALSVYRSAATAGQLPFLPHSLDTAVLARLRSMGKPDFSRLPDVSDEGLDNRLFDAAHSAVSLDELLSLAKTKRYTLSRIRRLVWNAFLGIPPELPDLSAPYARVLSFNRRGLEILTMANKTTKLPVSHSLAKLEARGGDCERFAKSEALATDLFSLGLPMVQPCGSDYTQKISVR